MSSKINIEVGLISKLLETQDIAEIKDLQIKSSFFSGENKRAYDFIEEYYRKNSAIPTLRVFKSNFPSYNLDSYKVDGKEVIGTQEPMTYWCSELRVKIKHNKIAEVSESVATLLDDFSTEEAYEKMKKAVLYIEGEVVESNAVDITKDTDDRKKAYEKRKESKGMIGIPMGIDKLDYILKGMQKSQLITMIGATGLGKTFFECLIGAYSMLNNYKVLQLVTEMSEDLMRDRYEAILFGKVAGEISYSRFKSGSLFPEEEKEYFDFLDNTLPKLEPLIIETATGVMNVSAQIDKHKPDLVLVDGVYLMNDDNGADADWLRIVNITRDLKKLAKAKKIPIFINTQADNLTSKKTGPELGNIGFSKYIGADSDVVLALFQDEQMREDREMQVKILKQREGILGNVMLNWDFSTMDFSSIFATTERDEDIKEEKEKRGVIEL